MSQHLAYESWMLTTMAKKLVADQNASSYDVPQHNAMLECLLLHSRVLIQFFYDRGTREQPDLLARHFFLTDSTGYGRWCSTRDRKYECYNPKWDDLVQKINYQIMHLSFARIGADKVWEYIDLTENIQLLMQDFLSFVTAVFPQAQDKQFVDEGLNPIAASRRHGATQSASAHRSYTFQSPKRIP